MSSSSSSECLCPDCIELGASFRTVRARNPFYQHVGQPLIYFAQTKQSSQFRDNRSRETRKCEPNCFVKAFRWYTQEHNLRRSTPSPRPREDPRLSEFAMWLDKKYTEFLEENENCDGCQPTTVPSCCKDDKTIASAPAPSCETCPKKDRFFSRVRSPWRKKHRCKEQTCTVEKRLESLEFILEPKELTRPASECCQQTPLTKPSGVSVVSSESQISKKTVIKTRTLEKNSSDIQLMSIEIDRNEGPNISRQQEPLKSPLPPQVSPKGVQSPPKAVKDSKQYSIAKDASCQCPETKLVTIDTETQYYVSDCCQEQHTTTAYQSAGTSSSTPSGSKHQVSNKTAIQSPKSSKYVLKDNEKKRSNFECQCSLYEPPKPDTVVFASKEPKKYKDMECNCVLIPTTYAWNGPSKNKEASFQQAPVITRCVNFPCECEQVTLQKSLKMSECHQACTGRNRSITCSFKAASFKTTCRKERKDTGLQTSDNAIDLERDGVRKYPLFMKIVYADKLKEDRPRM